MITKTVKVITAIIVKPIIDNPNTKTFLDKAGLTMLGVSVPLPSL